MAVSIANVANIARDPAKLNTQTNDVTTYVSYSGIDIVAEIVIPNEPKPLALGELQTISYSIHRENTPVRTLGHVNVNGFVKGPRTIAGSLIFMVFNTYAFYRLEQYKNLVYNVGSNTSSLYPLADMLPPFDIVLTFANEYGSFSKMKILGVTIVDEGGTMSIEDLVSEQTYTYMARGIQPLTAYIPDRSLGNDTNRANSSTGGLIPTIKML